MADIIAFCFFFFFLFFSRKEIGRNGRRKVFAFQDLGNEQVECIDIQYKGKCEERCEFFRG